MITTSLALIVLLASSVSGPSVSFSQDVLPILNKHCVMCHITGAAQGGLDIYPDPWTAMVGVPSSQKPLALIEPGSPKRSYLVSKLIGTQQTVSGSGLQMPFPQPLDDEEIKMIRVWIEQGAANN